MKRKTTLFILFIICGITVLKSQNIYVSSNTTSGSGGYSLGQYDVNTCTYCEELDIPASFTLVDLIPLPNGRVLVISNTTILQYDPPNPIPLTTLTAPGLVVFTGGTLAPSGIVYISGFDISANTSSLYQYTAVTNTITLIGSFPPSTFVLDDIFFWNGQLYSFTQNSLINIQIGNPLTATVVYTYPFLCGSPLATISSGPFAGIYTLGIDGNCGSFDLLNFNLPSNSTSFACSLPFIPFAMGEVPAGFPSPACSCVTDAGNIPTPNTNQCINQAFNFTNTGGFLQSDDIKQYILYSNPSSPLTSIVATSNTITFSFNAATMSTGITYYIAAIAGDNTNGNVNLSDPCLDISNAVEVIWRPLPTVSFTAANPNICAGACTTVTANFTGTPPFTLTYTSPFSGSSTQNFAGNSGTFQVCTTANAVPGNSLVQATSLSDAFCTCQ